MRRAALDQLLKRLLGDIIRVGRAIAINFSQLCGKLPRIGFVKPGDVTLADVLPRRRGSHLAIGLAFRC